MVVALVALAIGFACFALKGAPGDDNFMVLHYTLAVCTGISMSYFMLAFVGAFYRHLNYHSAWMRYFSDSAYWVFILHSVPIVLIALPLYYWQVPAEVKFLVVLTGSLACCFYTYHNWVRNTRIGEILNGQRYAHSPWDTK